MLIERRALEVSRLCVAPGDDVSAAATHVFIDEQGRVAATDGHCFLRIDGIPTVEPDLFMAELAGVDETPEAVALPADAVEDFLKGWKGQQVIVRKAATAAVLASADGETSREFSATSGTLDAPSFDGLLAQPVGAVAAIPVVLSVDLGLKLLKTLKALGASVVTLHVAASGAPVRVEAASGEKTIEGMVMPLRRE